jgi:hypothetical protein
LIQSIDARLASWVGEQLPGVETSFEPPADGGAGEGVNLFLLELAPQPDARVERKRSLRASLRYLVTSWAAKPQRAHELLGNALVAALQEPDFEVDLAPIGLETWTAFKISPRPSFGLRVPLRQDIDAPTAKLVRKPLEVRAAGVATLNGTVVGPGDVPIAGASVEVPALQLATQTDWKGRFQFLAVPASPPPRELLVKARGLEQRVPVGAIGSPVLIQFGPLEG